jgi:thioredoxin-like negative regulator of GroEL
MLSRRSLLFAAPLVLAASAAGAFEIKDYDATAAQVAIASGKPVVIHVYASWCLQCHMQKSILEGLKSTGTYDKVAFFRVDYDNQKDVVAKLDCPRSTVIAYKDGREVKRMSWGMSQASVEDVLKAAL